MAKRMGYTAASRNIQYIKDKATAMFLVGYGDLSAIPTGGSTGIVSANVSGADFTVASGAQGPFLTVGAKNSQSVEGSGTATHLLLFSVSGTRALLQTTVSSQVLASCNTVNIASWTVTANTSANNA